MANEDKHIKPAVAIDPESLHVSEADDLRRLSSRERKRLKKISKREQKDRSVIKEINSKTQEGCRTTLGDVLSPEAWERLRNIISKNNTTP